MSDLHIVVLAAGKGTRMKSALPKVLHRLAGRRMLDFVLGAGDSLRPVSTTIVVGHQAETVRGAYADRPELTFVVQDQQLGTAHALQQVESRFDGAKGTLLLLYGDVPLLRGETLAALLAEHRGARAAATVVTAVVERPYGYGRILRSKGEIVRIVEERDATDEQRRIREINGGIYAFDLEPLFGAIRSIASRNVQGEYYLPDLVAIYRRQRRPVATLTVANPDEIRGINSRSELAEVTRIVRQTKNEELMAAGVTLVDPATTYIEPDVQVGPDTVIHPNVYLEGRTVVGQACEIHAGVRIVDSTLGDRVTVRNFCVITDSAVETEAIVGPFSHLRPGSTVGQAAHVGNFVELKKTVLGAGSKANHLAYLGDATIGRNVNVGAGVITCNYDGVRKHQTTIGEGAFIGSDSQLVAPVSIGRGAYVAAGSSIVQDVPEGALGIARARQETKEGWVERKKGRSE